MHDLYDPALAQLGTAGGTPEAGKTLSFNVGV
jgi:hypothetical protein